MHNNMVVGIKFKNKSIFLLIIILLFSNIIPVIPHVQSEITDSWFVIASADDSWITNTGFVTTNINMILGHYSTPANYHSWYRFRNINIPKGSIIVDAKIIFHCSVSQSSSNVNLDIWANDEDSAVNPTSRTNFLAKTKTTATMPWHGVPAWTSGVRYDTPDLKDLVQEVIDRDGWVSGNALAFLIYSSSSVNARRYAGSWDSTVRDPPKLEITWSSAEDSIENKGIEPSDSTIDDKQWFFLNTSIEVLANTSIFSMSRIDIDPSGLNLSCSYINSTNTFKEENDPNNYMELDVSTSIKTDINSTNLRVDYYIRLLDSITKDGSFNVTVYSEISNDLNDTDLFTNVFTLTITTPQPPNSLFGAGFNASSPYVELHWNHTLIKVTLFEVQNSSNGVDWTYLGTNTTITYMDNNVVNGSTMYYKVRACRNTGIGWKNSSFTLSNFEKVYFITEIEDEEIVYQNVTGAWIEYNATSINVTVGTHDAGFLNSTYFKGDSNIYNITETTGSPAWDIEYNFTGLPTDKDSMICLCVDHWLYYSGNEQHDIHFEVYNYTSTSWIRIGWIEDMSQFGWMNFTIQCIPTDLIDNGSVRSRIIHEDNGNINHKIYIDYIVLKVFIPFEVLSEDYTGLLIVGLIIGLVMGIGSSKV